MHIFKWKLNNRESDRDLFLTDISNINALIDCFNNYKNI